MADIRVEPTHRRRSPIWPWVIGALLLIGLIWFVVDYDEEEAQPVATTTLAPIPQDRALNEDLDNNVYENTAAGAAAEAGPVAAFIYFAEQENDKLEESQEYAYISQGLEKLSAALTAFAEREGTADANINQRKETFRQHANQLQRNPQALQNLSTVKSAFMEATDLLAAIQERSYPDSNADIKEVREAAAELDVSKSVQEQQEDIADFYEEMGEALERMDGTTSAVRADESVSSENPKK